MVSVEGERGHTRGSHTAGSTRRTDRPGTKNVRDERPRVLFAWLLPSQFSEKGGHAGDPVHAWAHWAVTGVSCAAVISAACLCSQGAI